MQTIRSIRSMQRRSRQLAATGKSIGLVPTMGFLHQGHITLIERARKAADVVITTIFVNPAQFGPGEDYQRYPRNEKADLRNIKRAGGDIVFIPRVSEIYPDDFQTYVSVEELTHTLEGSCRPAHFRGVTTIVAKLFNITFPDVAVFGMKDYQQAVVLSRMTRDLGYPIKIIVAPTVRETDGLAMSSRNSYFTLDQRREALCLYYALRTAQAMVRSGIFSVRRIGKEMTEVILATCPSAKIDYIAFTDFHTLASVRRIAEGTVCSLAVVVHGVRLIDNMKLA